MTTFRPSPGILAASRLAGLITAAASMIGPSGAQPSLRPLDLAIASAAHGGADLGALNSPAEQVGAVLGNWDAAASESPLRLSVASVLPGDRLMLRTSLYARRMELSLATIYLQPNRLRVIPEFAIAYRLRHGFSIGAEYRRDPDNGKPAGPFGIRARSGAWRDVFLSWAPRRNVALTLAHVDLGNIERSSRKGRQTGHFLSAEFRY